jgi:hypothetical protein
VGKEMKAWYFSIILFFCFPCISNMGEARNFQSSATQTVSFCQLMEEPHQYVGKNVRVQVTYNTSVHASWLSAVECANKGLSFTLDCEDRLTCSAKSKEIIDPLERELVATPQSLQITIEGKLTGPFDNGDGHKPTYRFLIQELVAIRGLPIVKAKK